MIQRGEIKKKGKIEQNAPCLSKKFDDNGANCWHQYLLNYNIVNDKNLELIAKLVNLHNGIIFKLKYVYI